MPLGFFIQSPKVANLGYVIGGDPPCYLTHQFLLGSAKAGEFQLHYQSNQVRQRS
jgi:hypothetical protein